MFIFERVTTPLQEELVDDGFVSVNALPIGTSRGTLLLQNLGNDEITITVGSPGITIPMQVNQNPAAYHLPNGSVQTKLARFSKASTMRLDINLKAEDIGGLQSELLIPTNRYSLSLVGDNVGSILNVKLLNSPEPGLIPLFFVDQDYQIDQLSTIVPDEGTEVLTVDNRIYDMERVSANLWSIIGKPGTRALVLYIKIVKVDGVYGIEVPTVVSSDLNEICLPQTGNLSVHWGGADAVAPDADYLPSNVLPFTLELDAPLDISCDGALNFAGIIQMPDEVEGTLRMVETDKTVEFTSMDELIDGLTTGTAPYNAHLLTLWDPTFFPRALFDLSAMPLPTEVIKVTVSREMADPIVFEDTLEKVMDQCLSEGLLLTIDDNHLLLGIEPTASRMIVTVNTTDTMIDGEGPSLGDVYHNSTTKRISANEGEVELAWDPTLTKFWQHGRILFTGLTGAAPTTVSSNVDFSMTGRIAENIHTRDVTSDYTAVCAMSFDPLDCRRINQMDNYIAQVNPLVAPMNGKIIDFNQVRVWSPVNTDSRGETAKADYVRLAIQWTSDAERWGYVIPEPIRAM